VAPNLKGRLARLRSLAPVRSPGPDGADPRMKDLGPRKRPSFLKEWVKAGDLAWKRSVSFQAQFPESLDPGIFTPLSRGPRNPSVPLARAQETGERISSERLRFFDLETTGLSGGTGTIAFLAAIGRIEGDRLDLTQVFLEDFPGEGAFIEALLANFCEGDVIVSYNGRAFDMPLLRTRCVMNAVALPAIAHLDALYASRRLWRRVHGGASLGLLEREVLGIERGEDLPGAMIPEAWLGFARTGDNPLMRAVLSHNADDVVGLARLVARIQSIFDDPRSRLSRPDVDRAGLGRSLLAVGRSGEGEELLEAALGDGDRAAGLLLLMRYRKAERIEDCLRIASLLPADYRCATEKAKLYEWSIGDLDLAKHWADQSAGLAERPEEAAAVSRRLARLERKMKQPGRR
jgi:uncharacterized protein YprB with RNaseH-like and TPR domain